MYSMSYYNKVQHDHKIWLRSASKAIHDNDLPYVVLMTVCEQLLIKSLGKQKERKMAVSKVLVLLACFQLIQAQGQSTPHCLVAAKHIIG